MAPPQLVALLRVGVGLLCLRPVQSQSTDSSSIGALNATFQASSGAINIPTSGVVSVRIDNGWKVAAAGSTLPGYFIVPNFALYNVGSGNAGQANIGHNNTGVANYGYRNTGRLNTGTGNIGYLNTGTGSIGALNQGSFLIGDNNTASPGSIGYNITGDLAFTTGNIGINITNSSYNVGMGIGNGSKFCVGSGLTGYGLIGLSSSGAYHVGVNNTNSTGAADVGNIGFDNTGDANIGMMNYGEFLIGVNNTGAASFGYNLTGYYQVGYNDTQAYYNTTADDPDLMQVGFNLLGFNNTGILIDGGNNTGYSITGYDNIGCSISATGSTPAEASCIVAPTIPAYPISAAWTFPQFSLIGSGFNPMPSPEAIGNTTLAAINGFNATINAAYAFTLHEPAVLSVVDLGCPGESILVYDGDQSILYATVPGSVFGSSFSCTLATTVNDPDDALSNFSFARGFVTLKPGLHFLQFSTMGGPSAGTAFAFRVDTFGALPCNRLCPIPMPFIGFKGSTPLIKAQSSLVLHGPSAGGGGGGGDGDGDGDGDGAGDSTSTGGRSTSTGGGRGYGASTTSSSSTSRTVRLGDFSTSTFSSHIGCGCSPTTSLKMNKQ